MKNKKAIFLGFIVTLLSAFITHGSAFAYSAIEQKALGYGGIYRCYTDALEGDGKSGARAVVGEIKLESVNRYTDIIKNNSDSYVPLPNGYYGVNNDAFKCQILFGGCNEDWCNKFIGLLDKASIKKDPTNNDEKITLLTKLGYSQQNPNNEGGKKCFQFKYKYRYTTSNSYNGYTTNYTWHEDNGKTNAVCSKTGSAKKGDLTVDGTGNDIVSFSLEGDTLKMKMWTLGSEVVDPRACHGSPGTEYCPTTKSYEERTYSLNDYTSLDTLSEAMLKDYTSYYPVEEHANMGNSLSASITDPDDPRILYDYNKAGFTVYSIADTRNQDNRRAAAIKASNNLLGSSFKTLSDLAFKPKEEYTLYKKYFDNYYNAKTQCKYGSGESETEDSLKNNGYSKITDGVLSGCYAKAQSNSGTYVNGLNENKYFDGTKLSFAQLAKAYSVSAKKAGISKKAAIKKGTTDEEEEGKEDAEKDPCYNSGIESMSWIICPAVENTSQTVGALEGTLRDWLQIKTNDTFKKQTYTAWNVFRNIANVILVIVFLAIIFSQLTGFGIDNYGIKKMLPRLIAMAILINLSYVICEIAVDLSNILGVGLSDMFKNIGYTINNNGGADLTAQKIVAIVLGLIAAGGTVAGIAIASGGGIMIVISLLLALLVALVAVLMFFVMLGARMIIVIIFTILSPVAFALYVLPNTQNLFKKWWKVFQAALIVFPICGALYGGSVIIKAIVINGDGTKIDFIPGLIAVVAPFLPFLLLPTLLKSALAGIGALGGTLTMLGNGLKKGASSGKGAIENTKAYKGAQERAADRSAERRATRIRDRLQRANIRNGGTADNLSGLSASQRRRLFQAQTTLNERNQQRAQDDVGAFDNSEVALSRAEAARDATEYKAFQDQFADPNADLATEASTAATWYNPNDRRSQQRMRALIGAMESKGMERQIFSMLESNPGVGADRVAMDALASSNNKVLKAYGKKGSGTSYRQFMSGGGMQQYASDKGTDFLNGLDDKALSEINKYSSNSNQIMSNDLLVSAAAQINSQDAANEVEAMLNKRSGFEFSGEQLAQFNASTISRFASRGMRDVNMYNALVDASNAIASDPKLLNGLAAPKRQEINKFRASAGLPPI